MTFISCGRGDEKSEEDAGRYKGDVSQFVGMYRIEPSRNESILEIRSDGTALFSSNDSAVKNSGEVRVDDRMLRVYLDNSHGEPEGSFLLADFKGEEGWRGIWQGDVHFLVPVSADSMVR